MKSHLNFLSRFKFFLYEISPHLLIVKGLFFPPPKPHLLAQGSHTTENSNGSLQILCWGCQVARDQGFGFGGFQLKNNEGFLKGQLKGPGDPYSAVSDHEILSVCLNSIFPSTSACHM